MGGHGRDVALSSGVENLTALNCQQSSLSAAIRRQASVPVVWSLRETGKLRFQYSVSDV